MMRTIVAALLLSSMIAAPAGAAQLYRWVDAQGRVEWRDTPPPEAAKQVEQRRVPTAAPAPAANDNLPYAVRRVAQQFPVTLWTTACGKICDDAKAHLARRGIPYTSKDAKADFESFRKLTGGEEVPVMIVGRELYKGYLAPKWDEALDAVGYPRATPAAKQ